MRQIMWKLSGLQDSSPHAHYFCLFQKRDLWSTFVLNALVSIKGVVHRMLVTSCSRTRFPWNQWCHTWPPEMRNSHQSSPITLHLNSVPKITIYSKSMQSTEHRTFLLLFRILQRITIRIQNQNTPFYIPPLLAALFPFFAELCYWPQELFSS